MNPIPLENGKYYHIYNRGNNGIDLFYTQKFKSIEELKKEINEYIKYYNNDRIKSNLNKMSPIKYRAHNYQN